MDKETRLQIRMLGSVGFLMVAIILALTFFMIAQAFFELSNADIPYSDCPDIECINENIETLYRINIAFFGFGFAIIALLAVLFLVGPPISWIVEIYKEYKKGKAENGP